MDTEKISTASKQKKGSGILRFLLWFVGIFVLLVVLILLFIPVYLSSDSGRGFLVNRVNGAVDGKFGLGKLSMGWFKGVELTDVSFADNAGTASVNVGRIRAKPQYGALLKGQVALGRTTIDRPEVVINFAEPKSGPVGEPTTQETKEQPSKPVGVPLSQIDLELTGGTATINLASANQAVQTLQIKNIESKVNLDASAGKSSFDLGATIGPDLGQSKLSARGNVIADVKKGWTLEGTSGNVQVEIVNLKIESLKPLFALMKQDIKAQGTLNAQAEVKMDNGRFEKLSADAVLEGFKQGLGDKQAVLDTPVKMAALVTTGDNKEIQIDKLNVDSSFCTVECTGGINKIDYKANADLAKLQNFAGQFVSMGDMGLAGDFQSSGTVAFDAGKISVAGQSSAQKLVIRKDKTSAPAMDVKADYDIAADTASELLTVKSLKTVADFGMIEIADSVLPMGEKTKDKLSAGISADVDLAKVMPLAKLFVADLKDFTAGGRFATSSLVSADRGAFHVITEKTGITNLVLSQTGQEPFRQDSVNLVADMTVNPDTKNIAIKDLRLEGVQGQTIIKVTKGSFGQTTNNNRTRFDGQLQAEYDLEAVGAMAGPFLPEGMKLKGRRSANVNIWSEFPENQPNGLLANLNGQAGFGFDSASWQGLNIGAAQIELKAKNGLLEVPLFTAGVNGGTLRYAGSVDLKVQPMLLKTAGPINIIENVNINDVVSRSMLRFLNPVFSNAVNVSGLANLQCDRLILPLKGAGQNDMVVAGTVSLDKVRLEPGEFLGQIFSAIGGRGADLAILPTKFTVEKGLLRYDNMQLNIGNNPVNFKGVVGLDKSIKDMIVELPFTMDGKTVRTGSTSTSPRIAIPVEGTIDKPSINLQKLLLEIGKQKLIEQLIPKGAEQKGSQEKPLEQQILERLLK